MEGIEVFSVFTEDTIANGGQAVSEGGGMSLEFLNGVLTGLPIGMMIIFGLVVAFRWRR